MKQTDQRTCGVCGARVARKGWKNSLLSTECSALCKRAKRGGRSRAEQATFEMHEEWRQAEAEAHQAQTFLSRVLRLDREGLNYNRPYLLAA